MVQVHLGPLPGPTSGQLDSDVRRVAVSGWPAGRDATKGKPVKTKLLVLLAAAGGLLAFKKRAKARSEAELWQEATRPSPDLR